MTVVRRWWFWAVAAAVLCAIVLVGGLRVRQARVAGDPSFRALAVVALARDGAQHPLRGAASSYEGPNPRHRPASQIA